MSSPGQLNGEKLSGLNYLEYQNQGMFGEPCARPNDLTQ
jgi:hypothetical protein